MKKVIVIVSMIFASSVFAKEAPQQDALHETMAQAEVQKPETLRRMRDTIQVNRDVAIDKEGYNSPSVKAINSFGDFFERRVKASNGNK